MFKKHLLFASLLLISFNALGQLDTEFSGNLEAQTRKSHNNDEAKEAPLFQDWDDENFHLLYGNLSGKVRFKGSRLESNVFARYSQSNLYSPADTILAQDRSPYLATQVYTFPNRLVARDVLKLYHRSESENSRTEAVINKLHYEWDYEEHKFLVGRMYINYGIGEIFNPINPFNQPTGLTTISQTAQGSDGFNVTFFVNEKYSIDFYLLGDKNFHNNDGRISRTLWAHGEYQATDKLQLDFVIGEDQKRQKAGGQVRYNFEEAMVFFQGFYQSAYIDKKESNNFLDFMLGFDQQLTNKWHVRMESGYQKKNRYLAATDLSINERFLPTEYFVALANIYEVHPLVKLSGTVINDIKSGFTYLIAKSTWSFGENSEAEIFGYIPAAKGDEADNLSQKLVTTDVGLALRTFF